MIENKKVKRTRNKAVTVRMTDSEYKTLQSKVNESGLTQQSYIINSIKGSTISSSEEVAVQKELSKTFTELVKQLRGLATNVNQMAHVANGRDMLPTMQALLDTHAEINDYRKESEELWQLIRSSINQQKHTEQ